MAFPHWFVRLSVTVALVAATAFCGGWKWDFLPQ